MPSIVSAVADRLSNTLIQEAAVLRDVERRVEWIARELRLMQASLEQVERRERGFNEWAEELKDVAVDAEDAIGTFVIRSVKRRRRWIFSLVDRYTVGKELERIIKRIRDISQQRMKHDQSHRTDIDVVVETPKASGSRASPETTVARALRKLSRVLSESLGNSLIEIVEEVRDDVVSMQMIVSNLRSREQPTGREEIWLEEVNDVCGFTVIVIEDFLKRREEWFRMGWLQRLRLLLSASDPESLFMKEMKHVGAQTGGALRRGLTYGIEEEEGVVDKIVLISTFSKGMVVEPLSLREFIIRRAIYVIIYATIAPLFRMVHLPYYLMVPLCLVSYAIVALPLSVMADLWKAKPEEKLRILMSIFWSSSIDFVIIAYLLVDPLGTALYLQVAFSAYKVIKATMLRWASLDEELESIQRDSALMQAFLGCAEGVNERHRIWVEQMRVVDEKSRALLDRYEIGMTKLYRQQGVLARFFRRLAHLFMFTPTINDMWLKMHNIWERKIIYCISNIEEGNRVFTLGQSTQGSGSEFQDDSSGAEEDPLLPAGSNNRPRPKGPVQQAVESIQEDLQLMKALFEDAKRMGELDDRSDIWVKGMKDIAREIKFVSNKYASELEGKPICVYIRNYEALFIILKKISQIRNKIRDASRRSKTYVWFTYEPEQNHPPRFKDYIEGHNHLLL